MRLVAMRRLREMVVWLHLLTTRRLLPADLLAFWWPTSSLTGFWAQYLTFCSLSRCPAKNLRVAFLRFHRSKSLIVGALNLECPNGLPQCLSLFGFIILLSSSWLALPGFDLFQLSHFQSVGDPAGRLKLHQSAQSCSLLPLWRP